MSKDLLKNVVADRMIKEMMGKFSQHQPIGLTTFIQLLLILLLIFHLK